jgi:hypothetical protein
MGECKTCRFYDKGFDDAQAMLDDMIVEDQQDVERHFCPFFTYPEHIPPETYDSNKHCKYKAP